MTQIFNFNGAQLRMIEKDGQPWFVLKDVCDLLDLRRVILLYQIHFQRKGNKRVDRKKV